MFDSNAISHIGRYQNRVAGDRSLNQSSDEEDNVSETKELDGKAEEKVSFSGMSALKSQWETGSISANSKSDSRSVEDELAELRRLGKGSEPLKQVYERAIQEAKSSENLAQKGEPAVVDTTVKAVSIKEKFEKGKIETESEEERIDRLRKEREDEIAALKAAESELAVKEARNKFKQIEANQGKESLSNGSNGPSEDVSINPDEMQERFKYFENLKSNQSTAVKENSKDEVDDIPKVDTTKKMLSKFKALEAGQVNGDANGGVAKSPRRITPPKETMRKVYENEPLVERDPNIGKGRGECDGLPLLMLLSTHSQVKLQK